MGCHKRSGTRHRGATRDRKECCSINMHNKLVQLAGACLQMAGLREPAAWSAAAHDGRAAAAGAATPRLLPCVPGADKRTWMGPRYLPSPRMAVMSRSSTVTSKPRLSRPTASTRPPMPPPAITTFMGALRSPSAAADASAAGGAAAAQHRRMRRAGGAAEAGLAAERAATPRPALAAGRQTAGAERCCCVCLPWQVAAGAAASCCVQVRMRTVIAA